MDKSKFKARALGKGECWAVILNVFGPVEPEVMLMVPGDGENTWTTGDLWDATGQWNIPQRQLPGLAKHSRSGVLTYTSLVWAEAHAFLEGVKAARHAMAVACKEVKP